MNGTKISYISGPLMIRGYYRMAGEFYPDVLTADTEPNPDEWGPDNYWSSQTYIDWFNLNIAKYGLATAQSKMHQAIDLWSLGGAEWDYCYNNQFAQFMIQHGIDVSTPFCTVVNTAGQVITDAGGIITNTTGAINNTTSLLGFLLPVGILGTGLYLGRQYLDSKKKKTSVSGRRKKRKR